MTLEPTPEQRQAQDSFRDFVRRHVSPHADAWDRQEQLPRELLLAMGEAGYWGSLLPRERGGGGMDAVTFGLLNEELGRGCSSVRSLVTVHCMVAQAVQRWGTKAQKDYWLPRLASGETLAAFGLTEPNVGSDAAGVESTARARGDSYVLDGRKRWVTGGQVAGLFLVLARSEEGPTAFLVERRSPGLEVEPISGMLGVRASMLADLRLTDCAAPAEGLLGRAGLGLSHVASVALDYGRYSVAWGCVGIVRACLEACLEYTSLRRQFGSHLREYQLIQRMVAEMMTSLRAARLLCLRAGQLRQAGDHRAIMETSIAKYFAASAAVRAAHDAVQVHGAAGCSAEQPVQRYFRDAKIMEIIEGSTEMQQVMISRYGYQEFESSRS